MPRIHYTVTLLMTMGVSLAFQAAGAEPCGKAQEDHAIRFLGQDDKLMGSSHARHLKQHGWVAASQVATGTTAAMMRVTAASVPTHRSNRNLKGLDGMAQGLDINSPIVNDAHVPALQHRRNLKQRGWIAATQVATGTTDAMMRVTATSSTRRRGNRNMKSV